MSKNYGYACINMHLSYPKKYGNAPRGVDRITTNRSMIKRTFMEKGTTYASHLAHKNEEWFDTDDLELTESYLYAARDRFWNGIKKTKSFFTVYPLTFYLGLVNTTLRICQITI